MLLNQKSKGLLAFRSSGELFFSYVRPFCYLNTEAYIVNPTKFPSKSPWQHGGNNTLKPHLCPLTDTPASKHEAPMSRAVVVITQSTLQRKPSELRTVMKAVWDLIVPLSPQICVLGDHIF